MKPRILVIRGGAIGDFVLTLPALRLLREAFGHCDLVLLGYRHILELANGRYYADETRSIEYGPLSRFFIPDAELDEALVHFFGTFQQVISYVYDPDRFFQTNIEKCGVKNFLRGNPKINDRKHAVEQLAEPLQRLALYLDNPAPRLYPTEQDRARASELLGDLPRPFLAIHPGSGSPKKNWPVQKFLQLIGQLDAVEKEVPLVILGGEADYERIEQLHPALHSRPHRVLKALTLPEVAAVLEQAKFYLGHDTGISHIAAATGTRCLLLFGPTDPDIWAPPVPQVTVIRGEPVEDEEKSWEELEEEEGPVRPSVTTISVEAVLDGLKQAWAQET